MAELSALEILQKRVDALMGGLPQLAEGDAEAIHHTRVATRRLREVLPVVVADSDKAKELRRRLREVNRILGPIRELDVLSQLIAELKPERRYSLAAVGRAVREARKGTGRTLEAATRKLKKLASGLNDAIAELESAASREPRKVRRSWIWGAQARVIKRASDVRSAMDRAGMLYASGPLHEVRVSIKKLRYAIELCDEIGDIQPGAVQTLKYVQDLLGRQHDLEVLQAWDRQVQLSAPQRSNWRELASQIRALEKDCRELHARYIRECSSVTSLISRVGATPDAVALWRAAG